MEKTRLMLKIENKINEKIEDYLLRRYNHENMSGKKLARDLNLGENTIYSWLKSFDIPRRTLEDYIVASSKRPPKGVLKHYYERMGKSVREVSEEREVDLRTIYRWMQEEGVERRHGTNAYLKKGIEKPSRKKLGILYIENKLSREKIAKRYGVHPETVGTWLIKAELNKKNKSIYDNEKLRKRFLDELLSITNKSPNELSQRDFKNNKRENGRSYYGILTWYLSRYGHSFSKAKERFIKEFYI